MAKFCVHERHGGICEKTGGYCNMGACPYEDLQEFAEVRHARWEKCDYIEPCVHGFGTIRNTNAGLKCSNCVNVFMKNLLWKENYCPNCGAKMDLKEESHDTEAE